MFRRQQVENERRFRVVSIGFLVLGLWIVARLFYLQIIQYNYFNLFALSSHEIYKQLHPERGQIYFKNSRDGQTYAAAINKQFYLVYAVPKEIPASFVVSSTAKLAEIFGYDEIEKKALQEKLSSPNSSYKVLGRKVDEETVSKIKEYNFPGIFFNAEEYRYYPEGSLAGPVLGFTTLDDSGKLEGKYGLEGYYDKKLSGRPGFTMGEKGAMGGWIALADRTNIQAENGPDLFLTIDRALEYKACERLRQGMEEYKAKSAALILMDPKTGAILAMCSLPDFDPNNYSKVDDIRAFNNTSIFEPYEPGSVFKAITMAAGLDANLVSPNTTFTDPCELNLNGFKIRNAEHKCYGVQTMTQVLENSINTGAAWVEAKLGNDRFYDYVKKFGFGDKTGITLNSENAGDISSLTKKGEVFGANGSFGQGLTATPLQVANAYAAVANNGTLMKPYIVEARQFVDGHKEKTLPEAVDQSISSGAAKLLTGMLVSVVENHYHAARIDHYYVAGKTGTAQIPENGKYSAERTNHTFAGYAPATDPRLVLVVKYAEPDKKWAEQTALPVFKDVLKFALDYYGIPGDRP